MFSLPKIHLIRRALFFISGIPWVILSQDNGKDAIETFLYTLSGLVFTFGTYKMFTYTPTNRRISKLLGGKNDGVIFMHIISILGMYFFSFLFVILMAIAYDLRSQELPNTLPLELREEMLKSVTMSSASGDAIHFVTQTSRVTIGPNQTIECIGSNYFISLLEVNVDGETITLHSTANQRGSDEILDNLSYNIEPQYHITNLQKFHPNTPENWHKIVELPFNMDVIYAKKVRGTGGFLWYNESFSWKERFAYISDAEESALLDINVREFSVGLLGPLSFAVFILSVLIFLSTKNTLYKLI